MNCSCLKKKEQQGTFSGILNQDDTVHLVNDYPELMNQFTNADGQVEKMRQIEREIPYINNSIGFQRLLKLLRKVEANEQFQEDYKDRLAVRLMEERNFWVREENKKTNEENKFWCILCILCWILYPIISYGVIAYVSDQQNKDEVVKREENHFAYSILLCGAIGNILVACTCSKPRGQNPEE